MGFKSRFCWEEAKNAEHEAYQKSPQYLKDQEEEKKRKKEEAEIQSIVDKKIANEVLDTTDHTKAWNEAVSENKGSGAGIIRYAERWGKLMQVEMRAAGLSELTRGIIQKTELIADNEGMSGASASCARNLLIGMWIHGSKLGIFSGFSIREIENARSINEDRNTVARAKMKNRPQRTAE